MFLPPPETGTCHSNLATSNCHLCKNVNFLTQWDAKVCKISNLDKVSHYIQLFGDIENYTNFTAVSLLPGKRNEDQ
eukprot:Awhi_evm1s12525